MGRPGLTRPRGHPGVERAAEAAGSEPATVTSPADTGAAALRPTDRSPFGCRWPFGPASVADPRDAGPPTSTGGRRPDTVFVPAAAPPAAVALIVFLAPPVSRAGRPRKRRID